MSYIKFETRHLGDERWLDATPAAFTVHTWALDYCNEQATDGAISKKVAHRLVCPVEPAEIPAAFAVLVDLDLWEHTDDGYRCAEFLAHGLPAEEQRATRDKWRTDKERQRLHRIGNHQMCTPRSCPAARETSGSPSTTPPVDGSTSPPVDKWTIRPDSTRPPRGGAKSGRGAAATSSPGSAGAPPDPAAAPLRKTPPPPGYVNPWDLGHEPIVVVNGEES